MIPIQDYKRYDGESDEEYQYRICSQKDLIGSWQDVTDIINNELGWEFSESKYRKTFAAFQKLLLAHESQIGTASSLLDEIKDQKRELEKEKVKFRDERNEVSRILREQARKENFIELIRDCIDRIDPISITFDEEKYVETEKTAVVHLTDIHAGIDISNYLNSYNQDILKDRIEKYYLKIHDIKHTHSIEDCVVVLGGDLVSGIIHSGIRIENNQNVIEQTMLVCDVISNFLAALSGIFTKVRVYSVEGNHSRVFPNKDESISGESFDALIPYILSAKLQMCKNVSIISSNYDSTFGTFTCRGKLFAYAHGDKDSVSTIVQNMTFMIGQRPDCILIGHRHTNGITTVYDCKVVESGCVSGSDRYCLDKRLRNRPEQMVLVCDDNGIDCAYDIQLD